MNRHTFWTRIWVGLALASCGPMTGCAPGGSDFGDGEEAPAGAELRATIGAAGGVIEGLDGFRLEIPAGALVADTEIIVRPAVDATPLAQTAERVGPAFSLSPEDLALAVPARVTVPVDPELRAAWDVPDTDCRVWQRTAEAWERREQTASTPESVTVEIERLSTLAAGVLRTARTPTCATGRCVALERLSDRVCFEGTTMCMQRIGALTQAPLETASLTVDGGTVYYLFSRATNTFNVGTFSLDPFRAPGAYTELVASPTAPVGNIGRLAVGANGDVWASLTGVGNVRFRPTSAPARFDTGVVSSPAGVVIEDANRANVVRLNRLVLDTQALYTGITATSSWEIVRLPSTDVLRARAVGTETLAVSDPFQFFATRSGEGVFGTRRGAGARSDVCGSAITVNADAAANAASGRSFWVACSDRRVFVTDINGTRSATSPSTIGSFALDSSTSDFFHHAYATDPSRAELVVVGRNDLEGDTIVARAVPLTDAAPGTAEHARMLPRAIRYDASRNLLVLVTAGVDTPEVWTLTPQTELVSF
jgi:hypothetical protein